MRTIAITHTDWSPNPHYLRQPFTDRGRFEFSAQSYDAWLNTWFELSSIAKLNCAAIGCRGSFDPHGVSAMPIARRAWEATPGPKPTITFWCDTVGLPDITHNLFGSPFDFANPDHIAAALDHFFRHFFDHWKTADLELLDGELVMPWWGWAPPPGSHGWRNTQAAQTLLDAVTAYAKQQVPGLRGVKHIVAAEAFDHAQTLRAYAAHNWFNPWTNPPRSYTITQRGYGRVPIGCVVPGYSDPNHPLPEKIPASGDEARLGLSMAQAAGCLYVILEGAMGFIEGIEWVRPADGNTDKLRAIAEFSEPYVEDVLMATATFCLRRAERKSHPTRPHYFTSPYPGSSTGEVLSVQQDGSLQPRPAGTSGAWESWREEGNRAVFDDVFGFTYALPLVD